MTEVLLGCAERDHGIRRLWKALRHDAPDRGRDRRAARRAAEGAPLVQVFQHLHAGHGGKLSWARVWRGPVKDGATLDGSRIGGMWRAAGGER